jgi:DNA-binding MarR family transcriptional regulator
VEQEETLAESFWAVARQIRHRSRESLAPWDVTPSQTRAVVTLMRHGTIRLSELSDHLRIAARSVTEVVDGLQERGFVERLPDPHDRRATLVQLTDRGTELATSLRAARAADAEGFFAALSDADRAELGRILRTLRG